MIIASHRRSGTHFLLKSLQLSFGKKLPLLKTHGLMSEVFDHSARVEIGNSPHPQLLESFLDQPILYIVRDPRDTLASNYYWWKNSGESKCGGIASSFKTLSPLDYISGEYNIQAVPNSNQGCGVTQSHINQGIFSDPVGFWVHHVSGYLDSNVPIVRFEDLLLQPKITFTNITTTFNLKRPWWFRVPRRLVGNHPRKGIIGDYQNVLGPRELEIIEQYAGPTMQRLGYTD